LASVIGGSSGGVIGGERDCFSGAASRNAELAVEGTGPGFSTGCGRLVALDLCGLGPSGLVELLAGCFVPPWVVPRMFCLSLNYCPALGELCC